MKLKETGTRGAVLSVARRKKREVRPPALMHLSHCNPCRMPLEVSAEVLVKPSSIRTPFNTKIVYINQCLSKMFRNLNAI